jgi:hypothetical protein
MEDTMKERTTLLDNIKNLNESDMKFALSLLSRRVPSEKQIYWIGVLADKASGKDKKPETFMVENMPGIVSLFEKASANLKYPKIRLQANDTVFRLTLAGSKSRVPGSINVCSDKGQDWYGRITDTGKFEASRKTDDATMSAIHNVLMCLAKDPAGTAAAYGKMTGNCCFCSQPLSDDRSVAVGYGPVCAKHYGLPH